MKNSIWSVLIAIVLAVFLGYLTKSLDIAWLAAVFDIGGTLFLNALLLVVVPLIAASIITGVARIGGEGSLGRIGGKTITYFLATNLIAILLGFLFVVFLSPTIDIQGEGAISIATAPTSARELILSIIPSSLIQVFAGKQILGLIVFSIVFGWALSKVKGTLLSFWEGIFKVMLTITNLLISLLPLGVLLLVGRVFATTGFDTLPSLLRFALAVLLALAVMMFVVMPLFLRTFKHLRVMWPAIITGFSTSSSSATLPVMIDCLENRAGVSNQITGVVVPLATSLNLAASALYVCAASLFIASAYGIPPTLGTYGLIISMSLVLSLGIAGIPSGALISILIILGMIGIPAEGLGLIMAIDRIMDMCRSAVNVSVESGNAILIARWEGEKVLKHLKS